MENIYVNPIDTLDKLLNVENENLYTDINYFKLWIKTSLEQREEDFATLNEISSRLSAKFKKSEGNGNDNSIINEYVLASLLQYICMRESLNWDDAFKALENVYGYLEYSNIDPAYVLYLVGRLFYDIQEYYEDYIHIRTEFEKNINRKTPTPSLQEKFDYINKDRVENSIRALLPNVNYQVPDKFYTTNDVLEIAELFFENAYKKAPKEHYMAWAALTCQKKGVFYFNQEVKWLMNNKNVNSKEEYYSDSKKEFSKAISKYERTIEIANKNINNLLLNIGICCFYQEMIAIHFEKDVMHAYEYCQKSVNFLSKTISSKDESEVKSEYTFRRNPLDVFYYRLVALFGFIKDCSGKLKSIEVQKLNDNYLYKSLKDFCGLLEKKLFSDSYQRVEYYITMAEITEHLQEKGFVVREDICSEVYWEKAKELDIVKFEHPFRIGLAFNDKKYGKKWSEELNKIKHILNVDTSSNDYLYYQNQEIKNHFQKDDRANEENNES